MSNYIKTLLEEKNIQIDTEINIEDGNIKHIGLTLENVIEFISSLPKEIQKKIKLTLTEIDFRNGDIMHYFKYIAKGMVQ